MAKLYESKIWLRKKYVVERKSEQEIADICGTSLMTINRWLRKFELKRNK